MSRDEAPSDGRNPDPASPGRSGISDEIEKGVRSLLENKAPELFARRNFRVASELVDSAASTLLVLRERVEVLEAERRRAAAQETEWRAVLDRWQEIAGGLKDQVQDLERRLAEANRRAAEAEARALDAVIRAPEARVGADADQVHAAA